MTNRNEAERTEGELIAAVAHRGDESAFRRLYRRHTPRLLMVVQRLLAADGRDAEDIVQETWIRAVAGLADFRGEATFATWLTGIGLNVARNHLRRQSRRRAVDLTDIVEPVLGAPSGDDAIDLERAVALLPDGYRTVLVLYEIEGWTHGEIAAALGVTTGTSKSQLFAARRWLRSYLGGSCELDHERGAS